MCNLNIFSYVFHSYVLLEQGRNQPDASTNAPQPKIFTDEELSNLIDPILEMDDLDKDGYIDYAEFMHAQTKGSVKEEL